MDDLPHNKPRGMISGIIMSPGRLHQMRKDPNEDELWDPSTVFLSTVKGELVTDLLPAPSSNQFETCQIRDIGHTGAFRS